MGELGELAAKTARSRFVALAVRAAQAALSLVGVIVLARLLKPDDFGVVAMVVPFVALTNVMGNGGFQTTLLQSAGFSPPDAQAFFRFAVRMNLLLTAGFALLPGAASLVGLGGALALLAAGQGTAGPALSALISRAAADDAQGSLLGVSQSLGALARVAGPLAGGASFAYLAISAPYLGGAALSLAALAVLGLGGAR